MEPCDGTRAMSRLGLVCRTSASIHCDESALNQASKAQFAARAFATESWQWALQLSQMLQNQPAHVSLHCVAGRISFKVINRYIQATGGLPAFGTLILIFLIQEGARIGATVWLSVWTSSNDATGRLQPSLLDLDLLSLAA